MVGNLADLPEDSELAEAFGRFPSISSNGGSEPAPAFTPQTLVESRESNQSHLRISYRPKIDPRDPAARSALNVYSTLLGGSMGSRLFDEIREQRGLAYSVYAVDHSFADVPILQLSAGLDSGKCVEAYTRMREIVDELRTDGPREEEFDRAKAYAAGRRVLAFENTNAVARYAATQAVVFGAGHRPRRGDRLARPHDVRRGRRGRPRHLRGGLGGVRRAARSRRVHRANRAFRPTSLCSLRVFRPDSVPDGRCRADRCAPPAPAEAQKKKKPPKPLTVQLLGDQRLPRLSGGRAARARQPHRRPEATVPAGGIEYLATQIRNLKRRTQTRWSSRPATWSAAARCSRRCSTTSRRSRR